MPNKYRFLYVLMLIALLSGCAYVSVNIPLTPGPQALKEQDLEGQGNAKILLVDVTGMISEKDKEQSILGSVTPSMVAQIHEALKKAEQDPAIVGVIVRINSPGGTTTASDLIHHDITRFKNSKHVPVYACITGVGASGGYYIAAAADDITAHPTAVTGSIVVLLLTVNVEGLLQKIGVSELTIKSGDKKDLMSPFRPATPEEKKIVQTVVNQLHQRFKDLIVSRPGSTLSPKEVDTLADGRIYTAEQALSSKLIDHVGYLDD
ncbi:MAG: signal peptide peptidase SppA, partial [Syntrophales bacterium]|nr:signal peptide peptidase SppA [Syntrophales bacterium]